jgi:hypothetical protein
MRILATLGLLLVLSWGGPPGPAEGRATSTAGGDRAEVVAGLEALHAWDVRREQAWAATDAAALRSLYVPGSGAGRADLRLLRAYAAHGLVVRRIVTQVFAVRVLHRGRSVMRLRVFDRVAGGEVVQDGRPHALRSSPPVSRDVELRLGTDGWRVASVTGSGRGPRAARR